MAEDAAGETADKENGYELIPSQDQPAAVGKKVFELVGAIIADKNLQGLHTTWLNRYRLSRNNPWKQTSTKVPLLSANLLHTHRQRTVNTLTDNNPTFNMARIGVDSEEDDDPFTDMMHTAEHWWNETEQQSVLESSVNDGEMNGCCIEKVVFDPDLEYGLGEVDTINVDPFHFGVYPVDTRYNNQKAEANLHFYPVSLREAKRDFPQFADQIKADTELIKELGDERREVGSENTGDSAVSRLLQTIGSMFSGGNNEKDTEQTLMIECYVKDYSTKNVGDPVENDKGEIIQTTEPVYPGGIRRITVCSGGTVVLEDRGNPNINPTLGDKARLTYLYDKFPFIMVQSIKDSQTIWGQSDWEQLEHLQKEFAKTLSQWGYFKDKSVRPKIINPLTSGVSNDEFTNVNGILNPTDELQAAGIKYLQLSNSNLMAEMQGSIELIQKLFFLIAGTFELEQAQGGQVTAYKAIAALMEHAATMMRGKIRSYQKLVRERGRMYISHVQNFYVEDRFVTYEEEGRDLTKKINGRNMIHPTKLTVVSGSTLPRAQMQEREEALELYKLNAIDQPELLRKLDWPNRAAVVKRMQAGPLGFLFERLGKMGVPPEILQAMQEIAAMNPKEFEAALKKGELPSISMPEEGTSRIEQIEMATNAAELENLMAENDLLTEKIVSERVDQQVKMAGVTFDAKSLEIERARVRAEYIKEQTTRKDLTYNERGMKSNNRQQ